MLSTSLSAALQGIDAQPVLIEVNTGESGDPKLIMVGLPDAAVKESDDRVFSALANCGFRKPQTRTTINLAPGDLRKEGPIYDLPIALGILASTGQMNDTAQLNDFIIAGELSLSGATRPIKGGLAFALQAKRQGKRGVLLPLESAREAALVDGIEVYGAENLAQAKRFIEGSETLQKLDPATAFSEAQEREYLIDFSEVKGQAHVKRAVEIAVAGGHNIILIGPPGSGKSMIAKRVPTIMPEPNSGELVEILQIQSAAGNTIAHGTTLQRRRPFRSPHHTISDVGLLGGGSIPGPGEISLAHNGVLFMDEFPEFKRSALEVMRQPMEDRVVTISRSAGKVAFPCNFMLVGAMNPCPCGYLGSKQKECSCSPTQIQRYRNRISGPLLDRIDLHVEAPTINLDELRTAKPGESSTAIRERINKTRNIQHQRFHDSATQANANMERSELEKHCMLEDNIARILQQAMERLGLSARAHDRILKVARTIADLDHSESIFQRHLTEAIQYRSLDRETNL